MTTNENVQYKKPYNTHFYDYDMKSTKETITRDIKFVDKSISRFDNNGIFGDLFDKNKHNRFGSPAQSACDFDKVERAKMVILKAKPPNQKKFSDYVLKNVESLEGMTKSKCLTNIKSKEDLRQMSVTNLKVYKRLKDENEELPSLEKVSHADFLPNFIKKRGFS